MNNLRYRQLSKKISRPNGRKAIKRIEAELNVLIDNSPNRSAMPATETVTREALREGLRNLRALYLEEKFR